MLRGGTVCRLLIKQKKSQIPVHLQQHASFAPCVSNSHLGESHAHRNSTLPPPSQVHPNHRDARRREASLHSQDDQDVTCTLQPATVLIQPGQRNEVKKAATSVQTTQDHPAFLIINHPPPTESTSRAQNSNAACPGPEPSFCPLSDCT